jgi:hypothetical protein
MRIFFNKPIRILIIALLSTLILIGVTSTVVSLFYEQAVVRYLKKYLDDHLVTQISMDDIRFRVLKGFPNAMVEISNVVLLSGDHFAARDFPAAYADTLLKARRVSFQFDLIKLFHKDYQLRKIEINDGIANLLFDSKGRHNLHIWKTGDSSGVSQYSVNLQSIVASGIRLRWVDVRSNLYMTALSHTISFKGTYIDHVLSGEAHGNFSAASLDVKGTRWMNRANFLVQLKMVYAGEHFRIREGKVRYNKADITVQGEYAGGRANSIDLSLGVAKFGLGEFVSLFPWPSDSLINQYRFTGHGSMKARLKGSFSHADQMQISSTFNLADCSARNLRTRTNVTGINVEGMVSGTNAANFSLSLHRFSAQLGRGKVSGDLEIRNLHDLLFKTKINADLDLATLQGFLDMDTVESLRGKIQTTFDAEGKLSLLRPDSAVRAIEFLKDGSFNFHDVGIKLKNSTLSIQHITGLASVKNAVVLDSLYVTFNDNKLLLNGTVQNLGGYLLGKGILFSDLTVSTDNYSINYLLQNEPGSGTGQKKQYVALFPKRMNLKARVHAGGFDAAKFRATNLSLTVALVGDSMYIPDYSLNFHDGFMSGNALISQNDKHLVSITCNAASKQINIQQLFTAFNNFAQNFIVDKNLRGKLNGTVHFFAQWDSTLHFIPRSLLAKGELEIADGELVGFDPMLKLSKYINVEELRLIRFKTLSNTIFIQNRLVTIPEMDIHSTAFNISAEGTQTFDNLFEYRINVLLSEVLFNKARKKKKEMEEFLIEDDKNNRTTIPLIIAGTPDNFDVKFDRKRAFGLNHHKTENNIPRKADLPDAGNFRIEWDDSRKPPAEVTQPPAKQDGNDFKIEWDENSKPENNDLN